MVCAVPASIAECAPTKHGDSALTVLFVSNCARPLTTVCNSCRNRTREASRPTQEAELKANFWWWCLSVEMKGYEAVTTVLCYGNRNGCLRMRFALVTAFVYGRSGK
jgi:hypothetical protein